MIFHGRLSLYLGKRFCFSFRHRQLRLCSVSPRSIPCLDRSLWLTHLPVGDYLTGKRFTLEEEGLSHLSLLGLSFISALANTFATALGEDVLTPKFSYERFPLVALAYRCCRQDFTRVEELLKRAIEVDHLRLSYPVKLFVFTLDHASPYHIPVKTGGSLGTRQQTALHFDT